MYTCTCECTCVCMCVYVCVCVCVHVCVCVQQSVHHCLSLPAVSADYKSPFPPECRSLGTMAGEVWRRLAVGLMMVGSVMASPLWRFSASMVTRRSFNSESWGTAQRTKLHGASEPPTMPALAQPRSTHPPLCWCFIAVTRPFCLSQHLFDLIPFPPTFTIYIYIYGA